MGCITDLVTLPTAPRPHALPKWEKYAIFRMPVIRWNIVFRVPVMRRIFFGVFTDQFVLPDVGEAYMRVRAAENAVYLIVAKNIQGRGMMGAGF